MRLIGGYPNFDMMAVSFYHLYLLYMRKGEKQTADSYVVRLK